MNEKIKWRTRAKRALETYFQKRRFLRFTISGLLIVAGLFGFLVSVVLLRYNVDQMWVRYPISVLAAYGFFLGLIRIWVEVEKARFDPNVAEIQETLSAATKPEKKWEYSRRKDSWWDWLDIPDFGLDFDDGCLVGILLGVLIGLIALVCFVILSAPGLLVEVFLDAFLVSALYRRFRIAAKEHWLGTAVRKTWMSAVATAALLGLAGWCLQELAPGTRSIGPAVEQILRGEDSNPES